MTAVTQTVVSANGVRLSCLTRGDGPVVLLLHGFPDLAVSWEAQMEALAAAGYRAVAPDLRGYGESERPEGIAAYALDVLARDVAALADQLGGRVHLVGHDWGGVIAWHVAMQHPAVLRSLTIINAPHPKAFRRELARNWAQRRRSWYMLAFQVPVLPELALRALTRRLFATILREGTHSPDARAAYRQAFATRAAWRAAVHYYRALFRIRPASSQPVTCPTQILWGLQDPYLGPALIEGLERWVPDLTIERLPNAGHWAQWSAAEAVNHALLAFVSRH